MGIRSDAFLRELPSAWTTRLKSKRYFTFDGGTFEVSGSPPHQAIEFTLEHLRRQRDPGQERALDLLTDSVSNR